MKSLLKTCIPVLLLAAAIDGAMAESVKPGDEHPLRIELAEEQIEREKERRKRAGSMAWYGAQRDPAYAEDYDGKLDDRLEDAEEIPAALDEYNLEQEKRQSELDDEYRNLVAARLLQDAEQHDALREIEKERARGANVEDDYRELMDDRREKDAEHRDALRKLDRRRAELNQRFAIGDTEVDVEGSLTERRRPWYKLLNQIIP